MKREDYIKQLNEISSLYADHPPLLTAEEIESAIQVGKLYGSTSIFTAWQDYQKEKPGAHFDKFLVDVDMAKAYMPREKAQLELRKILVDLTQKKKVGV